jgi:hypothetical protein
VAGVDLGADPRLVDTAPGPAALEGPKPVAGTWPKSRRRSAQSSAADTFDPECLIFPGEGEELVNGEKKNRFT